MRKSASLYATAAIALALATPAFSDDAGTSFMDMKFDSSVNVNASDLIGMRVYVSENDLSGPAVTADGQQDWDDIGEVDEIILTRSGDVASVIIGVGGLMGIGEKSVAIDMSQLNFVSDGDDADEYFLVVKSSVAGVKDAPEYTMDNSHSAGMDAGHGMALSGPDVERDGYHKVEMAQLTTEMLTGARVYGTEDEDVGEISELLMTSDGKLDRAVIDVGGFLGMGEKPIAVPMGELTIMQNDDDVRVYIDATEESLESQPEYEG